MSLWPGQLLALWPVLIPSIRERESLGNEGLAGSDLWLWGNLAQRQLRLSPASDNPGWGDVLMASLRCLELEEQGGCGRGFK